MTIIIKIFLWLDQIVYNFIGYAYQLFLVLAQTKFFENSIIQDLTNRIYVILGVVMLFIITYALLRALVNPDEFAKGDTSFGKLAINIVIALVVIVITPTIFTFAFDLQKAIVNENILGKIILGDAAKDSASSVSDTKNVVEMAGYNMASTAFSAFFYPAHESLHNMTFDQAANNVKSCEGAIALAPTLGDAYNMARMTGSFVGFYDYARNAAEEPRLLSGPCTEQDYVTYNFLLSTMVGMFILYVMVSFCIDLGVRVVKLGFYQVITPVPAFSRIIPGQKKIFDNWIKVVVSTFLEVFIRLLVIFFAILIVHEITENWNDVLGGFQLNFVLSLVAKLFVMMGLVMFMKQAPKLISDMFGLDSGNMKLGIGEKLAEGGALVAAGAIGSGLTSAVRGVAQGKGFGKVTGFLGGAVGGAVRGAKSNIGSKNFGDLGKNTSSAIAATGAARLKGEQIRASGGYIAHMGRNISSFVTGMKPDKVYSDRDPLSSAEYYDDMIESFNDYKGLYDNDTYRSLEAQSSQYESLLAAGVKYHQGHDVAKAKRNIDAEMKVRRMESIAKNKDGASYAAYTLAQQALKNGNLARQMGFDDSDMAELRKIKMHGNKVTYDGKDMTTEQLYHFWERESGVVTDKNGVYDRAQTKTQISDNGRSDDKYMAGFKKKAAVASQNVKNSVPYKQAKRTKESLNSNK